MGRLPGIIARGCFYAVMGAGASCVLALLVHWYTPFSGRSGTARTPSGVGAEAVIERARLPDTSPRPSGMPVYQGASEYRSFARTYVQVVGRTYVPESARTASSTGEIDYVSHVHRAGWPLAVFECINRQTRPADPSDIVRDPVFPGRPWTPEYIHCVVWTPPRPEWLMALNRPYVMVTPTRPLALGLAVDTVFWALALAAVAKCVKSLSRRNRRRHGRCPRCAYALAGLEVCPECGTKAECAASPASS